MTDFSILVAVYNTEVYLRECLDSLVNQTHSNIQIICIDDCSTDHSLDILREYAQKDSRINVIALEKNGGQAHARNEGLKIAKGKYVGYLDSDDWLAPDALEKVKEVFDNHPATDCVLMRFYLHHEKGCDEPDRVFEMPDFEVLEGKRAFELSLDSWAIHGCYVARKELFDRFPYDESCLLYSDDNTTHSHYLFSREVRQCEGTYYYRIHPKSQTNKISIRRFDYILANLAMKKKLKKLGCSDDIIKTYENFRWLNFVDAYMLYYRHGEELTSDELSQGLSVMHDIWKTFDRPLLDKSTTRKWGYNPMPSWRMFLIAERLYFIVRRQLMKISWLHITPIK